MLRERVLDPCSTHQFDIPRSLGYQSDLGLALLSAIPGVPRISQLIKIPLANPHQKLHAMSALLQGE
jgi:hypothetical protein